VVASAWLGLPLEALATEIGASVDTTTRTARRNKQHFTIIPGGNIALLERRSS